MNVAEFAEQTEFSGLSEIDRVERLVFFLTLEKEEQECEISLIAEELVKLHFARPNITRLKQRIRSSRRFVAASTSSNVKLSAMSLTDLRKKHPELNKKSEEVKLVDGLIPSSLIFECPTYVARLAKQINASYECNIFDGCAVLMRRLFEILLIKCFESIGEADKIRDAAGNYKMLEAITANAVSSGTLALSRTTKSRLERVMPNRVRILRR